MSQTESKQDAPKKTRTRPWAKEKQPDECCVAENLGDVEPLPGSALYFRRCRTCNRRYFLPPREATIRQLREAGDEEGAKALENAGAAE